MICLVLNSFGDRVQFGNGSVPDESWPQRRLMGFLKLRQDFPPRVRMWIAHPLGEPGILGCFRLALKPLRVLASGIDQRFQRRAVLGGRGDQGVAEAVQLHQGTLRIRGLVQTGRNRSFFRRLGIVVAIACDRQVNQVQRPQIAVEDFGSQREKPFKDVVEFP